MRYYQAGDHLIQMNPENPEKTYRIKNTTERGQVLSEEDFINSKPKELNKQKFSQLMNQYFVTVKHEWKHDHSMYRKLPNFETGEFGECTNYDMVKIPKHNVGIHKDVILVYHWGNIYYLRWSYCGYINGYLIDIRTHNMVRWTKPKHCAPVFKIDAKVIV